MEAIAPRPVPSREMILSLEQQRTTMMECQEIVTNKLVPVLFELPACSVDSTHLPLLTKKLKLQLLLLLVFTAAGFCCSSFCCSVDACYFTIHISSS